MLPFLSSQQVAELQIKVYSDIQDTQEVRSIVKGEQESEWGPTRTDTHQLALNNLTQIQTYMRRWSVNDEQRREALASPFFILSSYTSVWQCIIWMCVCVCKSFSVDVIGRSCEENNDWWLLTKLNVHTNLCDSGWVNLVHVPFQLFYRTTQEKGLMLKITICKSFRRLHCMFLVMNVSKWWKSHFF